MKLKSRYKNILVVYKLSSYQKFILTEDSTSSIRSKSKPSTIDAGLIKDLHNSHCDHNQTLETIKKLLSHTDAKVTYSKRTDSHVIKRKYDLIITVGGDGTILRTLIHQENPLILGINSAPRTSTGALCALTSTDIKDKLLNLLTQNNQSKILTLPRLQTSINGKKQYFLAVNDILFTNVCPAATSRYDIILDKTKESQKSSGVWIATARGSTAALQASGGKVQKISDKRFQYCVREPYLFKTGVYRHTQGFVAQTKALVLINRMMQAKLYFDGPIHAVDLKYGDKIKISYGNLPIKMLVPK